MLFLIQQLPCNFTIYFTQITTLFTNKNAPNTIKIVPVIRFIDERKLAVIKGLNFFAPTILTISIKKKVPKTVIKKITISKVDREFPTPVRPKAMTRSEERRV